ncbi:hypothetical protein [Rubrimonas cliftonensis]|uniref:Uncharacterized protein n=1 Tax=Rubrimonas cliftonensis TaxID=89524 RepID=A0A1H4C084_9RHOB|nr:hypothetical protein [Rubrimonas cliftonensis]SEA53492.1 hypothetical protein SAMN05444370_106124 [Rubrimonas cliftonensis]
MTGEDRSDHASGLDAAFAELAAAPPREAPAAFLDACAADAARVALERGTAAAANGQGARRQARFGRRSVARPSRGPSPRSLAMAAAAALGFVVGASGALDGVAGQDAAQDAALAAFEGADLLGEAAALDLTLEDGS